jgi:hypothetical protein
MSETFVTEITFSAIMIKLVFYQASAEVKNAWSYTSIPPLRFHGVVLS